MTRARRLPFLVALISIVAVGVPAVIAADPSTSPGPPDHVGPPDHARDRAHAPKVEVTLRGTVERSTDDRGRPTFTLTLSGTTYELSAGPKWFHDAAGGPLAEFVGRSVEIHGWQREGTTDVSVDTVDGQSILPAGRPPWAGGPKVVGERHPGWKAWGDGHPGRGLGRAHAPGLNRDALDEEAETSD